MKFSFYLISFSLMLAVGCSTIETKNYEDFNSSIKKLNASTEEVLKSVQKKSREHGIQKFAFRPQSRPSDLLIKTEGYEWDMAKPPLYLTFKKVSRQLEQMNNLFEEYVDLLSQIASASLTKEELVDTAQKLDKNSSDLAQSAGIITGKKKAFTILSSVTVGLLQSFVDSKKEEKLRKAVLNNQSSVKEYASLQVDLIQHLRDELKQTYNEEFFEVGKKWSDATSRKQLSSNMFDLNDSLIETLAAYESLEHAYLAIPLAHIQLAEPDKPKNFRSKIERLVKSSNKLMELQKEVSKGKSEK